MEKTIQYAGKNIFYQDLGNGMPVMFIHGFAEDRTIWGEQIKFLENNFRLLVPDIPGSGRSETISYEASIADHADWMQAILEKEQISKCTIIGHSMGGYITLAFAEKFPVYLNGIGLFHSSAYPDTEEKKEARRKSISIIREYGSAPFIEQSTPNLFSEFSKKNRKAVIDELIVRYSGFDPLALISYYEAMIARPERTGILKSTVNPIMFIIGEEDKAVPLQHSLEQCHVPFCSFIYISKDTAHMGMIEDTDASNNFIRKFLDYVTKTSPK